MACISARSRPRVWRARACQHRSTESLPPRAPTVRACRPRDKKKWRRAPHCPSLPTVWMFDYCHEICLKNWLCGFTARAALNYGWISPRRPSAPLFTEPEGRRGVFHSPPEPRCCVTPAPLQHQSLISADGRYKENMATRSAIKIQSERKFFFSARNWSARYLRWHVCTT